MKKYLLALVLLCSYNVFAACTITTTTMPPAYVGVSWSSGTIFTSGCTLPLTTTISVGSIPGWATLNTSPLIYIHGTPTGSPTATTFTIKVVDHASNTATQAETITTYVTGASPTTASVLQAVDNSAYTFTPVWTGGNGALTYSISSGSLPTGLSINSSTGNLHGTPSVYGYYNFTEDVTDTTPTSVYRPYGMGVYPILDTYGGYTAFPVSGCPGSYFRVCKVNGRWLYVTPSGNAWYQHSVYDVVPDWLASGVMAARYSGSSTTWGSSALKRMVQYGFNSLDIYYSNYVLPIAWNNGGTPANTPKLPVFLYIPTLNEVAEPSQIVSLGIPEIIKNECSGQDSFGYHGSACNTDLDIMDGSWPIAALAEVAKQKLVYNSTFNTSPWIAGISLGDSSNVQCLTGQGNTFGSGTVAQYPHCAQLIATASYNYNCYPVGNCLSGTWIRPINWSKRAWGCGTPSNSTDVYALLCNGTSYLEVKYGAIANLNLAWGTTYTTYGSTCGGPCTFGSGTGLMDEDGKKLGGDYYQQTNLNANEIADLNNFLYTYAYTTYYTQVSTMKTYDTNHLMVCGNFGGVGNGGIRPQVSQAFKDSGCNVVIMNWNSNSVPDTTIAINANRAVYDIFQGPIGNWYGISAQADSALFAHCTGLSCTGSSGQGNFNTQVLRAAQYYQDMQTIFNVTGTNSDHYNIGLAHWAIYDNSSEGTNWGFLTFQDNAYDTYCPTVVTGSTNAQGIACGGELRNYGNELDGSTSVTAANLWAAQQLLGLPTLQGIYITAPITIRAQ